MIKRFRQFFHEEKPERSVALAKKILDRITRKRPNLDYMNNITKAYPTKYATGEVYTYKGFDKAKDVDVPLDKIYSPQRGIHKRGLIKKLEGRGNNTPPIPYMFHRAASDTYHVFDGNHRVAASKLLRKKTIRAKVVEI